jgi:phosphopantothenoylcysteine synthetase/decarboxylase
MENELQSKQLDWPTIVEYFTKRGRPLSKDDIQKLIDDDRREKEEEESRKKAEADAERRRLAKLMEDLEDKEDYEEFE